MTEAEEQISELGDRMVEIPDEEQNKGKRMKRVEESLRELWDNIKCTNIQAIGSQRKKKKGRVGKFLKKL